MNEISVDDIRSSFTYDPATGDIVRNRSGQSAVFCKQRCAYISHHSSPIIATRVVYMLETGMHPVGLRTRFADGDTTNLRRANLEFMVSACDQPGKPRTLARIIDAIQRLGGQASTPMIRATAGFGSTVTLAAYMKLLESRGDAHVVGIDERHTQATGRATLMWALGPGEGRPAETRAITHEMIRRRKASEDIRDEERQRRRAHAAVVAAKKGATPNSIFAVGSRLI